MRMSFEIESGTLPNELTVHAFSRCDISMRESGRRLFGGSPGTSPMFIPHLRETFTNSLCKLQKYK